MLSIRLVCCDSKNFINFLQEPFFGVGSDILSPRKIGSPLAENFELGGQCFATMQTPVENFLVSCGNWDNSFHIISVADGRLLQSIRQHSDVVSCAAGTCIIYFKIMVLFWFTSEIILQTLLKVKSYDLLH